jgi:putative spermidine/putrescine transport system permease protein
MYLSTGARIALRVMTAAVMVFLLTPLVIVAVLSFNTSRTFSWPPDGLTLSWWSAAPDNDEIRNALWSSTKTALWATGVALVLGSLAAFAVHRFRFFGRETISLLVILPIALPGIVTGLALQQAFLSLGIDLSLRTLVAAHATFCIVVVYNNVIARLRRLSPNLEEASADLGADGLQTFRHVTFPLIRSALLAGALLAFGLSFDEIIVTTFTAGPGIDTLPQWILRNVQRPQVGLPLVNVVATSVVLLSVVPVWLAQRITDAVTLGGR